MFEGIITKVLTMNMTGMYNFWFFLSLFFLFFHLFGLQLHIPNYAECLLKSRFSKALEVADLAECLIEVV